MRNNRGKEVVCIYLQKNELFKVTFKMDSMETYFFSLDICLNETETPVKIKKLKKETDYCIIRWLPEDKDKTKRGCMND